MGDRVASRERAGREGERTSPTTHTDRRRNPGSNAEATGEIGQAEPKGKNVLIDVAGRDLVRFSLIESLNQAWRNHDGKRKTIRASHRYRLSGVPGGVRSLWRMRGSRGRRRGRRRSGRRVAGRSNAVHSRRRRLWIGKSVCSPWGHGRLSIRRRFSGWSRSRRRAPSGRSGSAPDSSVVAIQDRISQTRWRSARAPSGASRTFICPSRRSAKCDASEVAAQRRWGREPVSGAQRNERRPVVILAGQIPQRVRWVQTRAYVWAGKLGHTIMRRCWNTASALSAPLSRAPPGCDTIPSRSVVSGTDRANRRGAP